MNINLLSVLLVNNVIYIYLYNATYTMNDVQEAQSWFVLPELGTCRWEFFVMSYELIYILYYAKNW